jgi:hypothetical protein
LREESAGAVGFFSGFELAIDKLRIDGAGRNRVHPDAAILELRRTS